MTRPRPLRQVAGPVVAAQLRWLLRVVALPLLTLEFNAVPAAATGLTARFRSEGHAAQRDAIARSMTVDRAVQVLDYQKSVPSDVLALVQSHLGQTARRTFKGRSAGVLDKSLVSNAMEMLNNMTTSTFVKKDLECFRCSEYEERMQSQLDETNRDLSMSSSQASAARGDVLRAEEALEAISKKLPDIQDSLKMNGVKCEDNDAVLARQLTQLQQDSEVMSQILDLTRCAVDSSGSSLYACKCVKQGDPSKTFTTTIRKGDSFITFGSHALREKVGRLQSSGAQQSIQQALQENFQRTGLQERGKGRRVLRHRRGRRLSRSRALETGCPNDGSNARRRMRGMLPTVPEKAKCMMTQPPDCAHMRDKFLTIQTGLEDKADMLKQRMGELSASCKATKGTYEAQLESLQNEHKTQQANLASATRMLNQQGEQLRLKEKEKRELTKDFTTSMHDCEANVKSLETELCSFNKLRQELDLLEGGDKDFLDCKVSNWQEEECSKSCSGGMQKMYRTVVMAPSEGAPCPPLMMMKKCNESPCPTDCEVDVWSGWSSCTANCGGGVMERTRTIVTTPENGGTPCGSLTETTSCGVEACDQDCVLQDWTEWSACSKACFGGSQRRVRTVARAPVGQGTCPAPTGRKRLEFKACNVQPCQREPGMVTLQCKSKVDVVLLMDGSGSIGEPGWMALRLAAARLIASFGGDDSQAKVSSLVFGGPEAEDLRRLCLGIDSGPVDLERDCGMEWIGHLSSDTEDLAEKVSTVKWPQTTTLTSAALNMAQAEVEHHGRSSAESVVIVITDGLPLSSLRTSQAAASLRKRARLMWVPVTKFAPLDQIQRWASLPLRENVVVAEDFQSLSEPDAVDQIVANVCPELR